MRILVVGPGRSGTTWTATTLGTTPGAGFLLEPDGSNQFPFGAKSSVGLGVAPVLGPDDVGPPVLRRVWDVAYGAPVSYVRGQQRVAMWLHRGTSQKELWRANAPDVPKLSFRLRLVFALAVPRHLPDSPRHRVVKSIRSHFMLEWLLANWRPTVVVCRRHPLDVVASHMEMGFEPAPLYVSRIVSDEGERRFGVPVPPWQRVLHYAWSVGVIMSVLDEAIAAHPEFHVFDHEDVCVDPVGRFGTLARALGLEWTADDDARVTASNRPGTGYQLRRVAADLPGSWRDRLTPEDARDAAAVLAQFPIAARYDLTV